MAPVIPPRVEWLLPEPISDPPVFAGFGVPIATLLVRRGVTTEPELRSFLEAGRESLHPIELMADAETALARIEAAVERGERIAIWGDYDADGMTAVAIWVIALRALGAEALRYVPSRLEEGYGLSEAGLRRLAERDVTLVITCDCGIANATEVDAATRLGMQVIVTDHHLPRGELPRAVAVVDPHRPDCDYPDPDLTGAGIAYKLADALLRRRGVTVDGLAAIAAIGTVADMAPMTGESRVLVRLGLAEMATTARAGLRALLARAAEDPTRPTARDLGFTVAPRINAAGRIADAELAIRLLLEEEPEAAERLADELEEVHHRRRALTLAAVEEARGLAEASPGSGALLLRNDGWAPGLLGLVAGRLADTLARPVAIAALVGDELRGSVRAPADFHVAVALDATAGHLTKRGGHPGAGGFSLAPGAWDAFADAFAALPRPFPPNAEVRPDSPDRLTVDLVLPSRYLDWDLIGQIERLAPFGPGNREPVLAVTGLRLLEARRVGAESQHLVFRLRNGLETFDAIAFGTPPDRPLPAEGALLDLVGTLQRDVYQGEARLRMRVLDYAAASASPLLARRRATAPPVAVAAAG